MKMLLLGWLSILLAIPVWCAGSAPTPPDLLLSGFSVARLDRVRARLQRRVDAHQLAGAVYLVSRDGKPVAFQAVGWSDVEAGRPMEKNTLFRVYSMSKPVVGVAVLMLVEEGKLRLTDPISKFIPEFHAQRVAVAGPAGSLKFSTVAASRDITIRDLLTHTSGLGSGPISDSEIKQLPRLSQETLAGFIPRLGGTPLEFQPGTRWHYSGMAGFDTLGRVVEIVSGEPLDRYLSRHLFLPLGIKDMGFAPSPEQLQRLASVYRAEPEGLVKLPHQDDPINPTYLAGSSGLVSTVDDYFKFAQMLCGGGQAGGVRLLSPRMIQMLGSQQIPDTMPGRSPGEGWGLGVRVIGAGAGDGTLLSAGSFGWSGSGGTHFWVDPREGIVAVLMLQLGNAGGSGAVTARDFETDVMQALVELRPTFGAPPP